VNYLLDTHAFLWWIEDDVRLSKTAKEIIVNPDKDPFDRLLIAQSRIEQIPIVTLDRQIIKYPVKTIW
jgi:PIN domain nuclease of toxin-antitoxin system